MRILSFGDALPVKIYKRHSSFDKAVNFGDAGFCVCAVLPKVKQGPSTIVADNLDLFKNCSQIEITNEGVIINGVLYKKPENIYKSEILTQTLNLKQFKINCKNLLNCAKSTNAPQSLLVIFNKSLEPSFCNSFEKALLARYNQIIKEAENYEALLNLKGLGPGLTPAGDDFIAGVLTAMNFLEKVLPKDFKEEKNFLYKNLVTKNVLSALGLKMAYEGRVFERFKDLICLLAADNTADFNNIVNDIISCGATSGADTLAGFIFVLFTEVLNADKRHN